MRRFGILLISLFCFVTLISCESIASTNSSQTNDDKQLIRAIFSSKETLDEYKSKTISGLIDNGYNPEYVVVNYYDDGITPIPELGLTGPTWLIYVAMDNTEDFLIDGQYYNPDTVATYLENVGTLLASFVQFTKVPNYFMENWTFIVVSNAKYNDETIMIDYIILNLHIHTGEWEIMHYPSHGKSENVNNTAEDESSSYPKTKEEAMDETTKLLYVYEYADLMEANNIKVFFVRVTYHDGIPEMGVEGPTYYVPIATDVTDNFLTEDGNYNKDKLVNYLSQIMMILLQYIGTEPKPDSYIEHWIFAIAASVYDNNEYSTLKVFTLDYQPKTGYWDAI